MTITGTFQNGAIILDPAPTPLPPDGTRVKVIVEADAGADAPTLFERLKAVVGKAEGLPDDAAAQHDHYLYGTPKR